MSILDKDFEKLIDKKINDRFNSVVKDIEGKEIRDGVVKKITERVFAESSTSRYFNESIGKKDFKYEVRDAVKNMIFNDVYASVKDELVESVKNEISIDEVGELVREGIKNRLMNDLNRFSKNDHRLF